MIFLCVIIITQVSMVASSATNVCQPHIAGYFGATPYEANSIITAYIISGGIMLPVFGWWVNACGKKAVAYWSVSLFDSVAVKTDPAQLEWKTPNRMSYFFRKGKIAQYGL